MNHHMTLTSIPFERIKSGVKKVELRLYDTKRQSLALQDKITFTEASSPERKLYTIVKGLYRFESFHDLFTHISPGRCGFDIGTSIEDAAKEMRKYYSKDQEEFYGVIGIELEFDIESYLTTVTESPYSLEWFPDELKNDRSIVLAGVSRNGYALNYASSALKNDRNIVLAAVSNAKYSFLIENYVYLFGTRGDVVEHPLMLTSDALRNDRDIVIAAVKCNGSALQYISLWFRNDKDIVRYAVNNDPFALRFATKEIQNNPEFAEIKAEIDKRSHY